MFLPKWHLMMADVDPNPSFTNPTPGGAQEDPRDENDIIFDQDQTNASDNLTRDDNMGAISNSLDTLEDEPADFMRGEVDVKEQMDRAASALDDSIHGYESQADEDSPRGDLGASFRDTPGGLEEVEQKTEEDLAQHRGHRIPGNSTKH
jgi:hypothetical protein